MMEMPAADIPGAVSSIDIDADALDDAIVEVDRLISEQISAILHHPRLRALEGRWRGLAWLAAQMPAGAAVRLRVLPATWRELDADLHRTDDVRGSELYRKIYQSEFNTAGGEPFGLLIVDQEVSHVGGEDGVNDTAVVGRLAQIAAAAFAPVVVAAAPALLADDLPHGRMGFGVLAALADPASLIETPAYADWRVLRDQVFSKFVAVVLPRVLARPVWRDRAGVATSFRYVEAAASPVDQVWMTACYPFAVNVARAVARFGWPADIRGMDTGRTGGGLVVGLPQDPFALSPTFELPRISLDFLVRESQERGVGGLGDGGLIGAGFIPLVVPPFGTEPAFCSSRSLYRVPPPVRGRQDMWMNNSVGAQISAVLCASRFAHAIKVRAREMVGRLRRAEDIERELRGWLQPYINTSANAKAELRARCPLLRAQVAVRELPGRVGAFGCVMHLQPYFQLDSIANEFQFETELGAEAVLGVPGQAESA
jgi:type VI secretion system protein ImpD/type VI secretion system protein ImpC